MTLIQKLNDSIITNINIVESENRMCYEFNHLELAESCEVIADKFAIGFAEWLGKGMTARLNNGNWIYNMEFKASTTQELLERYKKEKGL